jgi:hypothetical protein
MKMKSMTSPRNISRIVALSITMLVASLGTACASKCRTKGAMLIDYNAFSWGYECPCSLKGMVRCCDGTPVLSGNITICNATIDNGIVTTISKDTYFSFNDIQPGSYSLLIEAFDTVHDEMAIEVPVCSSLYIVIEIGRDPYHNKIYYSDMIDYKNVGAGATISHTDKGVPDVRYF